MFVFFFIAVTAGAELGIHRRDLMSVEEVVNLVLMKNGLNEEFLEGVQKNLAAFGTPQDAVHSQAQDIISLKQEILQLQAENENLVQRISALKSGNKNMNRLVIEQEKQILHKQKTSLYGLMKAAKV